MPPPKRKDPLSHANELLRLRDKIESSYSLVEGARAHKKATQAVKLPPLMQWIPQVTPEFKKPEPLKPLVDALQGILDGDKRKKYIFNVPPQHGKSFTVHHFMAAMVLKYPKIKIAYATYSQTLTTKQQREALDIFERAGVRLDTRNEGYWKTASGAQIMWTSVQGPLTGVGIDLLVIDDPFRDRMDAESALLRERVWQWYLGSGLTRPSQNGNQLIIMTRWHHDDLCGRLLKTSDKWQKIHLKALSDENEPLWPELHDLEDLEERKLTMGEYNFNSLYQGEPMQRGGALFNAVFTYSELPNLGRYSIGVDFAYSAKTHADYSVAVVMKEVDGLFYIVDVVRKQVDAPRFAAILKPLQETYGCFIHWYTGGQEKGIADFMRQQGLRVKDLRAQGDKFIRAQSTSASWNAGKILLPQEKQPWMQSFLAEVLDFTGTGDAHDDCVDGLVSAFDALKKPAVQWSLCQDRYLPF